MALYEEPHEVILYDKDDFHWRFVYNDLPRQCPSCNVIATYKVKKHKRPQQVMCPICNTKFTVTRYKRGERPKGKRIIENG